MANIASAKKRIRQDAKRRARNRWRKRTMREAIKSFYQKLLHGTAAEATEAYRAASRIIDRCAQKGVIHRNQAARRKSRMNARLKTKAAA